jgi:hypothetical protein
VCNAANNVNEYEYDTKCLLIMRIAYVDPLVGTPYGDKTYPHYSELMHALQRVACVTHTAKATPSSADVRVLGLGFFAQKEGWDVLNIPSVSCPTVAYLYKAHEALDAKLAFCVRNRVDLIVTPLPAHGEYAKQTGIKTALFPYGFDPTIYYANVVEHAKTNDVGFSGALHSSVKYAGMMAVDDVRATAIAAISALPNTRALILASDGPACGRYFPLREYASALASTTVWLAFNSPCMDIPSRHFQVMASGALLLCERPAQAYAHVFRDGENCLFFDSDCSNIVERLRWVQSNPRDVERVVATATDEARTLHTWDHRARTLLDHAHTLIDCNK